MQRPPACGQRSAVAPGNCDYRITRSDGTGLICLTVNEIRRLHAVCFKREKWPHLRRTSFGPHVDLWGTGWA
jgi:hypothetical protein